MLLSRAGIVNPKQSAKCFAATNPSSPPTQIPPPTRLTTNPNPATDPRHHQPAATIRKSLGVFSAVCVIVAKSKSMATNSTLELETEPVGRLLAKYALPAIAGMIAIALYNVVDSIFIGQWVGEYALAGLAVAFPIMTLSVALGTLLGVGGASVCSIRLGEKDEMGAARAFGNVFSLGLVFGIPFGVLSACALVPILTWFGASDQTLPYAYKFMVVILFGTPVNFTFFNLTHIMRAAGFPNRALVAVVISVLINIILAPLFIKVFDWGIMGAAFATLTAQICGLLFTLHHFLFVNSPVRFRRGIYRPRANTVLPIISIGCAPSILNICACAIAVIINQQLLRYGGDLAVGAYGIILRILTVSTLTVVGLTQGMQPIVGYNHGARRYDRSRKAFALTFVVGMIITTICCAACQFCPRLIASVFTDNLEMIRHTVRGLHFSTAIFLFVGGQIVINNFFQAIGHGKTAALLSTTRQMLFLVPGLLIFPYFFGQDGVWVSMPVADLAAVVLTAVVFLRFLRNYKPVELR
ncbi:MAG: MATE family efflux transporter [Opitutae bacterium]|nr:MATE family efflux transporter [Opitutae bacterium]